MPETPEAMLWRYECGTVEARLDISPHPILDGTLILPALVDPAQGLTFQLF